MKESGSNHISFWEGHAHPSITHLEKWVNLWATFSGVTYMLIPGVIVV